MNGRIGPTRRPNSRSGHKIEIDVPSSELLCAPRSSKAIEQEGLQPGEVSLLIQADKAVRHERDHSICALMAGKMGDRACAAGLAAAGFCPGHLIRPLKTEP